VSDLQRKRTPAVKTLADPDDVAAYLCESAGVVTASGCGFMQDGYARLAFDIPDQETLAGMAEAQRAFAALGRSPGTGIACLAGQGLRQNWRTRTTETSS
jgi:hypothetical protein